MGLKRCCLGGLGCGVINGVCSNTVLLSNDNIVGELGFKGLGSLGLFGDEEVYYLSEDFIVLAAF